MLTKSNSVNDYPFITIFSLSFVGTAYNFFVTLIESSVCESKLKERKFIINEKDELLMQLWKWFKGIFGSTICVGW